MNTHHDRGEVLKVEGQDEGRLRSHCFITFNFLHHIAHIVLPVVHPPPAVFIEVVTQFTELH